MLHLTFRRSIVFFIVAVCLHRRVVARRGGADDRAGAAPKIGPKEGLTPCLAVAADGSPVWPSTTFPPMKHITVAFRLKPGETGKELKSKWKSLGDNEQVIAENALELKGQKNGFLRLVLKQPAPPGKYRLETTIDDQPWESVDLAVAPPITEGVAEKPEDLVPLVDGQKTSYDMNLMTGPGTTMEVPGVQAAADGTAGADVDMVVGKSDDNGTLYTMVINGKPVRDLYVKMDAKGLTAVKSKEGDAIKPMEPPQVVLALPPALEGETEWTSPGRQGGEQKFQFFGPLTVQGPAGETTGYVLFSDEPITAGEPGSPAVRGRETVEQHFVPKVGMVREVRVATLGGRLSSRQETTIKGAAADTGGAVAGAGGGGEGGMAYKMVADPAMKGRLGRIKFEYPKDSKFADARVAVFKPGTKKEISGGYGNATYELMPGKYDVAINHKKVPVEVKSGHNTVPNVGVLRVHAGGETRVKVLDSDKKTELHGGYGGGDIPLPVGSYILQIGGADEPIKIEDGKIVEF